MAFFVEWLEPVFEVSFPEIPHTSFKNQSFPCSQMHTCIHLPSTGEPANATLRSWMRPPWVPPGPPTGRKLDLPIGTSFGIPQVGWYESKMKTYLWGVLFPNLPFIRSYIPETEKMKIKSTEEELHQGGQNLLEEEINIMVSCDLEL